MDLQSLRITISRSENLPVLPQVVSAIIKLMDDPNSSAKSFERVIEKDAAISAKILRVAGSAAFGGQSVPSISRAITLLGQSTLRGLAVGIAYQQVIGGKAGAKRFNRSAFWQHSLATATCSRILGKILKMESSDEMYFAGMIHDIGLLVLDRFAADSLDEAIKIACEDGVELHMAEEFLNGFDHALVSDMLAEKWGLGKLIRSSLKWHHNPDDAGPDNIPAYIVAVSNVIAHQCGYRNQTPNLEVPELKESWVGRLNIPIEQFETIRTVVAGEVERATASMGIAA